MRADEYDAWYESARGRWIGETEFRLLRRLLALRPGQSLLDVGCGTGWFTRRFASILGLKVVGLDCNAQWLEYAREHDCRSQYLLGDSCCLPFANASFDCVVSIAALCFIDDWPRALREIVRVARGRIVVGTLNRASLLWRSKGQEGGSGAYRGARWHTRAQLRFALAALPVRNLEFHSAIFVPTASRMARAAEAVLPTRLPWGGLLVAAGDRLSPWDGK